jgi:hypothetical protein
VLRLSTPRRRLRIDHLEVHERGWGRRRGDPEPYAPGCLRSLMPPIAVVGRSVLLALLAVEQLGQFGGERGEILALIDAGEFVEEPGHDVSLGGGQRARHDCGCR